MNAAPSIPGTGSPVLATRSITNSPAQAVNEEKHVASAIAEMMRLSLDVFIAYSPLSFALRSTLKL